MIKNYCLEGKNIIKHLGFELNFKAHISYEEFCQREEYNSLISETAKKNIVFALSNVSFYSGREMKDLEAYENIFVDFLEHGYFETYHNLVDCPDFQDMFKVVDGEIQTLDNISQTDTNLFVECLLGEIKYFISQNSYYYGPIQYTRSMGGRVNFFTPSQDYTIRINSTRADIINKRKKISKIVKISQERYDHKIIEYLCFLAIVGNLDLVLLIEPGFQRYVITESSNVTNMDFWQYLSINLTNYIRFSLDSDSKIAIDEIRSKYKITDTNFPEKVYGDIKEIISLPGSGKIEIKFNKNAIHSMSFMIRSQNMEDYRTLKEFKRGVEGVTRDTSKEEYGIKENAVKTYGKIPYGKKHGKKVP